MISGGISYVLPLRWTDAVADGAELPELTAYLAALTTDLPDLDVVVVDGSPPPLWDRHDRAWCALPGLRHVRPAAGRRCANGKVAGVLTGLALARHELLVIADDDVRWTVEALRRAAGMLREVDVVRPQNYFRPMPWHAQWDTARTLLNRAVAADYPGTLVARRSLLVRTDGYDGEVLFENLELLRTVRAAGGREARPLDLYVERRPCSVAKFRDQRVRQAYDDLAQPWRLALFLPVAPLTLVAVVRAMITRSARPVLPVAAVAAGTVALAEAGRRRAGGTAVFPPAAPAFAPLWVGERAVCQWLAVWQRVRHGGVDYSGGRLRVPAHSVRTLRRRLAAMDRVREADVEPAAPERAVPGPRRGSRA